MEAADYAIRDAERALDRVIGEAMRRRIERYASALVLAVPIAWIGGGFRWNMTSFGGLCAGMALFVILDALRAHMRRPR